MLGKRAADYVAAHAISTASGGLIVSERFETPRPIVRTLNRAFGKTRLIGETAWWDVQ